MTGYVTLARKGAIAILTLNRPDTLNAIGTHEDCNDLSMAIDGLTLDRSISAAILTGAGRAFCAGGNLSGMRDRNGIGPLDQPDSTRHNYRVGVQKVVRSFMDCEVPLIAAINGHAIGVGCDLACLCDMRIASEEASFSASFIKVGIVPGDGGAWLLPRIVGYPAAAEMLFTGDRYNAADALRMGLINKVSAPEILMADAIALAEKIVANPARALRLTKRLLREGQTARMSEILELSAAYQALAHETADHREAVNALIEKRKPTFTGE